jgi:arginine decarboxylase
MLFKKFFVTKGTGESTVSGLNAFDRALLDANIGDYNHVPVTSILPKNAVEIKKHVFSKGKVTHCVMSRASGRGPKKVCAALGYVVFKETGHGVVMEYNDETESRVRKKVDSMLDEAARSRGLTVLKKRIETASFNIPKGKYGSAVVVLVFV